MRSKLLLLFLFLFLGTTKTLTQDHFIFGDLLPDAPELAQRGAFKVGVRTLSFIHENQLDILNATVENEVIYDRDLKVEVWYPAELKPGEEELVTYDQVMGQANQETRPLIPFTFKGRAARDANIITDEKFPLIVVSHGYTGSRLLLTYLTENLASKGYIVAAIDHKESTFQDAGGFQSTLLNRPKDILFVVDAMVKQSQDEASFLNNSIQENNIGIIGYSMGGYGVLNVAGAGYSQRAFDFFKSMTGGNESFETLVDGKEAHLDSFDPRIKAVVAFAPWGMNVGVWDSVGLSHLKIPTLFIAGSQDDISGYENGIKAIYDGVTGTEAYLLTYINARHNVAPNPPAPETMAPGLHFDEYYRYAEPAWDEKTINNINQHFVTAFLGLKLKNEPYEKYLDLPENSNGKTWEGFKPRSGTGLELHHKN
jgi:predicted dienelactone hydrolase